MQLCRNNAIMLLLGDAVFNQSGPGIISIGVVQSQPNGPEVSTVLAIKRAPGLLGDAVFTHGRAVVAIGRLSLSAVLA